MRCLGLSEPAALLLLAATIVIIVTPGLLDAPNSLAMPAALITVVGSASALLGGTRGRVAALLVSVSGLVLSGLWAWGASNGFGKGTPWWDDLIEAAVLAALFLGAAVLLLLARRHPLAR